MLGKTSFPLVNQNHSFYSHIPRAYIYKSPPTNWGIKFDESLHMPYIDIKKPFLFPSNTYHLSIFWLSNTCFILNSSTEMTGSQKEKDLKVKESACRWALSNYKISRVFFTHASQLNMYQQTSGKWKFWKIHNLCPQTCSIGNLYQHFFLTENRPQICDKDVVIVFKIINVYSHKPFYFLKQHDLGKELLTWLKRNWPVLC